MCVSDVCISRPAGMTTLHAACRTAGRNFRAGFPISTNQPCSIQHPLPHEIIATATNPRLTHWHIRFTAPSHKTTTLPTPPPPVRRTRNPAQPKFTNYNNDFLLMDLLGADDKHIENVLLHDVKSTGSCIDIEARGAAGRHKTGARKSFHNSK